MDLDKTSIMNEIIENISKPGNSLKKKEIIKEASEKYNWSENGILAFMSRNSPTKFTHQSRKLCDYEEMLLVSIIILYSRVHDPLTKDQIIVIVNDVFGKTVGIKFVNKFKDRHSNLISFGKCKKETPSRFYGDDLEQLILFIDTCKNKHLFNDDNIFNLDETTFSDDFSGSTDTIFAVEKGANRPKKIIKQENVKIVGLPIICANGKVMCFFFLIMNQQRKEKDGKLYIKDIRKLFFGCPFMNTRGSQSYPVYLAFTGGKSLSKVDFFALLDKFIPIWGNDSPGRWCFLYLDQSSVHICREEFVKYAKNNIVLVYLPAYTTQYLQPLDVLGFSTIKKEYLKLKHHFEMNAKSHPPGFSPTLNACAIAISTYLKPNIIISSFRFKKI